MAFRSAAWASSASISGRSAKRSPGGPSTLFANPDRSAPRRSLRGAPLTNASVLEGRRCLACADDFAHSPETSAAIAALINAGAINATSCLVESDCWREEGEKLRAQADGARLFAVGLHLNLTERLGRSGRDPILPARLALDRSSSFEEE